MRLPQVRFTVRAMMVAVAVVALLAAAGKPFILGAWRVGLSMPARSFRIVTYTPRGEMSRYIEASLETNAIRIEQLTNSISSDGNTTFQGSNTRRFIFR